jgi:hypothetical protein
VPNLRIHGGDFATGDGWYYSADRFALRDKNGRPEILPLSDVLAVDSASKSSMQEFGVSESLVGELAPDTNNQRTFVIIFQDGRLLVASTDVKSFGEIYELRNQKSPNPV